MARVAIIKLFSGLNLASAQLSGELQQAGHDSRIIYFKEHEIVDTTQLDGYETTECAGFVRAAGGIRKNLNCYRPFNETEFENLFKELERFNPDIIAMALVSGIINEGTLVTSRLRERFPNIPFIWGGQGPTLQPNRCISHCDLLCINEGEEVIVEAADRVDAGQSLNGIAGTWSKLPDGSVEKNPNRPLLKLDDLAMPDWDVSRIIFINGDQVKYNHYPDNLGKTYPLTTQRGCPFSCSFCVESKYQDMFGKKGSLRRRSPDLVIEELLWAKEHLDIEKIMFYDDVFTVNPRWLKDFLPKYRDQIGLPFWCYTYPTTHNPEILSWLKDAGCCAITMGVQSGSERILKEFYNRPTATDRVIEAGWEMVRSGIPSECDLITKQPFETEDDLKETFEFLMRFPQKVKSIWFAEMTMFPTYDFTEIADKKAKDNIATTGDEFLVSDKIYDYYLKLYRLTRMLHPRDFIWELANDPKYKENPELLDPYLTLKKKQPKEDKDYNPSITY